MNQALIRLFFFFFLVNTASANNMLVQNVTTTANDAVNKTIQVQFDISWDNSWRDAINWDAAWIFMKFKDANGLWQHAQLNQTGFTNGTGTANTLQVTSDNIGSWLYRSALGSGTFNSTGMQLQWNYGLSGLTNVTGLEVRVFAVEMVYVPEGDFNVAKGFYIVSPTCCGPNSFNGSFNAPGSNFPVINTKLSPTLTYSDGNLATIRIKGDAGIDTNNDGVIDNSSYPTGYRAFYTWKYELSEQQYADFLNTLTSPQINTVGIAGSSISLTNGQYFSSSPNKACINSNEDKLFAYADWSGQRPLTLLEFNKSSYGPLQPVFSDEVRMCCPSFYSIAGYPAWGSNSFPGSFPQIFSSGQALISNVGYNCSDISTRVIAGGSYYGLMDLTWNASEPVVKMNSFSFNTFNGNGMLQSNGFSDVTSWVPSTIIYVDQASKRYGNYGFRYCRSAE